MSQSNAIFAYLFIAFVIFITMRGKLPKYIGFLLGETSPDPLKTAGASGGGSGDSNPLKAALDIGKTALAIGSLF